LEKCAASPGNGGLKVSQAVIMTKYFNLFAVRPRCHFLIGVGPGLQMEIFSPDEICPFEDEIQRLLPDLHLKTCPNLSAIAACKFLDVVIPLE